MKKTTVLLLFCLTSAALFAQVPFTIHASNFPVYEIQGFNRTPGSAAPNLVPSANGDWHYGTYPGIDLGYNYYLPETDPFYTSAGIDVYVDDFKALNANLGYLLFYEMDFNFGGVEEKGIYVNEQRYGLGALTGNANDSLIFPFQGAVYTSGRKFMQFPASYQSGWRSQSRRIVNFNLTVNAAGLANTPLQHVFTIHRTDTIVGWGKMRVYANSGSSIPYDVLIDKSTSFAVDSFLLGGQPAPPALLTPFGMTQGQQTGRINRYIMYRRDYSTPLAMFIYGANNFTTPVNLFTNNQNLTTSDTDSPFLADFTTLLYPNPSSSGDINLQITGTPPALEFYQVIDQSGRVVQSGTVQTTNDMLQLSLSHQCPNGHYVLQVLDNKKQTIIAEPFVLERQ